MGFRIRCGLTSLLLLAVAVPSHPAALRPLSACTVSLNAADFVGKRVRVEGYVVDLSSHGFVLIGKRGCHGQLGLALGEVSGTPFWRDAFAGSLGPKHAVMVGVVRWEHAQLGGRIPVLVVERVESLAATGADISEFD